MTTRETSDRPDRDPAGLGMGKSIFPIFDVNVPMPKDTAIPGSYRKPAHPPADAQKSEPIKAAE